MEFFEKNGRSIGIAFLVFILVGSAMALYSYSNQKKEQEAQEKLATIEFGYSRYKQDVDSDKTKPDAKVAESVASQRSQLISQLRQFLDSHQKTIASRIASLYLSELLIADNQRTEAVEVLKKSNVGAKDLTSILVQKKLAALLSDNDQCEEALKIWNNISDLKAAKFASAEIKIMKSLCYQKMNDLAKAEQLLKEVKNDGSEASAAYVQHAERILKLIQFKKAAGS